MEPTMQHRPSLCRRLVALKVVCACLLSVSAGAQTAKVANGAP